MMRKEKVEEEMEEGEEEEKKTEAGSGVTATEVVEGRGRE